MTKRKVRAALWPHMEKLLAEEGAPYSYDGNGGLSTELSAAEYHDRVERAMCMEESGKHSHGIPCISLNMYLRGERPEGGFTILPKDSENFLRKVCQMTDIQAGGSAA